MYLTLEELRRKGLDSAISETVVRVDEARMLLERIGFPSARLPDMPNCELFWHCALEELASGVLKGDVFERLLRTIHEAYPGNSHFTEFAVMASKGNLR